MAPPTTGPQVDGLGALVLVLGLGAGTALAVGAVSRSPAHLPLDLGAGVLGAVVAVFVLPAHGATLASSFAGGVGVAVAGAAAGVLAARSLARWVRRCKRPSRG